MAPVPAQAVLAALVQRTLQLLTQPLGVLASLVLGHAEQHGRGVCSCNIEVNICVKIFLEHQLTDSLVPAVEQLGEGRGGSLLLDHDGALLVRRQLAQHAGSHALDVLDLVIQQLQDK